MIFIGFGIAIILLQLLSQVSAYRALIPADPGKLQLSLSLFLFLPLYLFLYLSLFVQWIPASASIAAMSWSWASTTASLPVNVSLAMRMAPYLSRGESGQGNTNTHTHTHKFLKCFALITQNVDVDVDVAVAFFLRRFSKLRKTYYSNLWVKNHTSLGEWGEGGKELLLSLLNTKTLCQPLTQLELTRSVHRDGNLHLLYLWLLD